MTLELGDFPEVKGIQQAGVSEDELRRIARHPYASRFLEQQLEDIDLLADPRLQESLRQMEAGKVVDLRPPQVH